MSSTRWKRSRAAALAAAASFVVVAAIAGRDGLVAWFLGDRAAPAAVGGDVVYTCPMDPSVEAHAPGKCPLCGMDLTRTSRADRSGLLYLDRDAMQRIGVRLAAAEKRTLTHRVVAFGSVVAPAAGGTAAVEAIVYGDDPAPSAGAAVGAVSPALPLTRFSGSITSSAPEPEERAARLRVALSDPGRMLRAGQPIELEIATELTDRLVVPAGAILYVGKRRLVFVDRGRGGLELRELDIGIQDGDLLEVRRGLEAGQRVVESGTFLVAAESRIRSANPLWDDGEVAKGKPKAPAAKPAGGKP